MRRTLVIAIAAGAAISTVGLPVLTATPAVAASALPSRTVALAAFDRIVLDVPADVEVRIADRDEVRITAEQKVIDSLRFDVKSGALTVAVARNFSTREPVRIVISCRSLVALSAVSSVEAKVGAISGDRFELRAAASSTVDFASLRLAAFNVDVADSATVRIAAGQARAQKIKVGGSGSYTAGDLRSETVSVVASGSSDSVVNSRDTLDATVSGSATVHYSGKPKIRQSISDAGSLEQQ